MVTACRTEAKSSESKPGCSDKVSGSISSPSASKSMRPFSELELETYMQLVDSLASAPGLSKSSTQQNSPSLHQAQWQEQRDSQREHGKNLGPVRSRSTKQSICHAQHPVAEAQKLRASGLFGTESSLSALQTAKSSTVSLVEKSLTRLEMVPYRPAGHAQCTQPGKTEAETVIRVPRCYLACAEPEAFILEVLESNKSMDVKVQEVASGGGSPDTEAPTGSAEEVNAAIPADHIDSFIEQVRALW